MRLAALLPPVLLPAVLLFVAATGCGIIPGGDSKPTPTPTITPTPTATLTPTPSPTPTPPPQIEQPIELSQGRAAVVRVTSSAASAVAVFNGQQYRLLPREGGFWGVIGLEADASVGDYPISVALADGAGASAGSLSGTVTVYDVDYPVEQIELSPEASNLLAPDLSAQEAATRASIYSAYTPERLWSGPFIFPSSGLITSPYGIFRSYNGGPINGFHHGTDFGVDEGSPVVASNSGRVAFVGALPVRGNSVIIDHGDGVFSAYHHLRNAVVAQGQVVAQGELIAYSGATGLATGPHLHWEIVVGGLTVDPVYWTYDEVGP